MRGGLPQALEYRPDRAARVRQTTSGQILIYWGQTTTQPQSASPPTMALEVGE
jgi:hypothetical protein